MQNISDKFAGGRQIRFLPGSCVQTDKYSKTALDVIDLIMNGYHDSANWKKLQSIEFLRSVFYKRDHDALRGARSGFSAGFKNLFEQFKSNAGATFNQQFHHQQVLILSNCLSLLPYADIKPGQIYKIPEWDETAQKWNLIDYQVSAIELTPTWGFERLVLGENGRVFAYGLIPKLRSGQNLKSMPKTHLIFMGTTYPVGQGFYAQILSNLEAFSTPGYRLYQQGKGRITAFLDQAKKDCQEQAAQFNLEDQNIKARVHGISLGGSTGFFAALDPVNAPKISRVDAYNPPGLCEIPYLTSYQNQWQNLGDSKPEVYIQIQAKDPISSVIGSWLIGWNIIQVNPSPEDATKLCTLAHAVSYTNCQNTQFYKLSDHQVQEENKKRWLFNLTIYIMLRGFLFMLVLPFYYLILPMISSILNHKLEASILVGVTLTFMMMPGLITGAMGISILALVGAYFAYKLLEPLSVLIGWHDKHKIPLCHQPDPIELLNDINELSLSTTGLVI